MTIRFLIGLIAWLGLLFALLGLTHSTDVRLFVSLRVVAWSMFIVFCAYSLTRCLVCDIKSAFWLGATVFSFTALVTTMLAFPFVDDALGWVISDFVFFNVPDIGNAEPIDLLRRAHARGVFDLIVATAMTVGGGLVGQYHSAVTAKKSLPQ